MNKLLKNYWKQNFKTKPTRYFISPGRYEIVGNHTDHNRGLALVAGASLLVEALVNKTKNNKVTIASKGIGKGSFVAKFTKPNKKEFGKFIALVKGIVSGFVKKGYKVGGFDAACVSEVIVGGGVSSSAAFEMLVCEILNVLYNKGKLPKMEMVKIAQKAENLYFNKPCGLLDQTGACYGGISYVDFNNLSNPKVINTKFPFTNYKIVLINSGGDHSNLTPLYASIIGDMKKVSKAFKKTHLRDVSYAKYKALIKKNPKALPKSAQNRAVHYFEECLRVKKAFNACKKKDLKAFLAAVNGSGLSSSKLLKNTCVPGKENAKTSPERCLKLARKIAPKSAHRIHGGGFAGTTLHFVSPKEFNKFYKTMCKEYKAANVHIVSINPKGAHEEKLR